MSPRLLLVPLAVALIVLGVMQIAQAQAEGSISMSLGVPSAAARPGGEAVLIPFTISYDCETLWKDDITVSASSDETGVTATAAPATFTPTGLPDCTPGESQTHDGNITVTIAEDAMFMAGDRPSITVNASGLDRLDRPIAIEQTTTLDIAPMVAVTYTTNETMLTAQQGELVSILIDVASDSNDEISVATTIPDWNLTDTPPDILEVDLPAPGDNGSATNQIEILFEVPDDAEPATHQFTVQLSAAPAGDRSFVVTENLTYELTVVEGGGGGGGSNDSPGPAVPVMVVVAVAAAAVLRRRR